MEISNQVIRLYRFVHSSFHLFNAATKFISDHYSRHLSLFSVLLLLLLLHYPRFSTSTFLPTSNSLFNFYHSFPFSCYLFIYLSAFLYKSNKDASIISIFLALLGVDRREKWPLCSFLSLMIVRTKR